MADQKNRGGQKRGKQQPEQSEQKQGATTSEAGKRSGRDKQQDQRNNLEDDKRQLGSGQ